MKKTAFISDIIFTFLTCGLCTLCLFRYLRVSLPVSFLLSVVCGALAACSLFAFLQCKRKMVFLKKSDEAKKEKLLTHLALLSEEQKTNFFQQVLSQDAPIRRFGKSRLYSDTQFFQIRCGFSAVTAEDVAAFSRLKNSKEKILLCCHIQEEALSLANRLHIIVWNADQIFELIKTRNAFPEHFLGEENNENHRQRKLHICFSKKNGKRFFTSGAMLTILSLFTPFSTYYLLWGGLLLLLALFIRIFGYEKADL